MNAVDNTNPAPKRPRVHKSKKIVISTDIQPVLPSPPTPVPQPNVSPAEIEAIQVPPELLKLLEQKLGDGIKQEMERKKRQSIDDYKPLEAMVSEYLKSFLLIGYGINGEKIFIGHAKTAEEHDSLVEHLRQTFINVIGNMPM